MKVAMDYDNTFTANPVAWTKVIEVLRAHGTELFCITSRFPNVPINDMPMPVYYTCGQQKWEFAQERGLAVDIWIDDIPSCIGGPPLIEPGQAKIRRDIVKQIIDANFNVGPHNGKI